MPGELYLRLIRFANFREPPLLLLLLLLLASYFHSICDIIQTPSKFVCNSTARLTAVQTSLQAT